MTSTGLASPIPPKRILIVEDDLVAAHTLRLALSVDHHKVDLAGSSEDGLSLFEANYYDLVIADFKLPKMDGLELAEQVKKNAPSVPVILLTAYAETVKHQMGGQVSNVDVLLGKPVSLEELHTALRKVFPAPQNLAPHAVSQFS